MQRPKEMGIFPLVRSGSLNENRVEATPMSHQYNSAQCGLFGRALDVFFDEVNEMGILLPLSRPSVTIPTNTLPLLVTMIFQEGRNFLVQ